MKSQKSSVLTLGLGVILIATGATYGAAGILNSLGIASVFASVNLNDAMKIFVSLYLTGAVLSLGLAASALYLLSKGRMRYAGWLGVLASVCTVATIVTPPAFAVAEDVVGVAILLVGAVSSVLGGFQCLRFPSVAVKEPLLSTMEIANSAVLSALTAVFTGIAFMPSPTGGYTHVGDTIIFIAALLFGPKVGAITGAIGSVAADLWVGYPRWFVSIPAHGLEGLIAGLGRRRSLTVQIICCALGGIVMASVYFYVNIFIKGWAIALLSYVRDILGQAGISIVLGIILVRSLQRLLPRLRR
ncbi:MAG: ECF transporter S component [archaeon]